MAHKGKGKSWKDKRKRYSSRNRRGLKHGGRKSKRRGNNKIIHQWTNGKDCNRINCKCR